MADLRLIQKNPDGGLTAEEIRKMLSDFDKNEELIPVEIQGENAAAMGFITQKAAERIGYSYDEKSEIYEQISCILDDIALETENGMYDLKIDDETISVHMDYGYEKELEKPVSAMAIARVNEVLTDRTDGEVEYLFACADTLGNAKDMLYREMEDMYDVFVYDIEDKDIFGLEKEVNPEEYTSVPEFGKAGVYNIPEDLYTFFMEKLYEKKNDKSISITDELCKEYNVDLQQVEDTMYDRFYEICRENGFKDSEIEEDHYNGVFDKFLNDREDEIRNVCEELSKEQYFKAALKAYGLNDSYPPSYAIEPYEGPDSGSELYDLAFCPERDKDGLKAVTGVYHEWYITTDMYGVDIGGPNDYNEKKNTLFLIDKDYNVCEIWSGRNYSTPEYNSDKLADWLYTKADSSMKMTNTDGYEPEMWIRVPADIAEEIVKRGHLDERAKDEFFFHSEYDNLSDEVAFEIVNSYSGNDVSQDIFPKDALNRVKYQMECKLRDYVELKKDYEMEEAEK